jgi:twitching motility protein PilT
VMVSTPTIREYNVNPDKVPMIHTAVAEGVTQYGMQTFDQSVLQLLRDGLISEEEALKNCNNPNELGLKLKGISAASDRLWQPVDASGNPTEGGTVGSAGGTGRPGWMSSE